MRPTRPIATPARGGARRLSVRVLVQRASGIGWPRFAGIERQRHRRRIGAEALVEEVIRAFAERFSVRIEVITTTEESVAFNLPRQLREPAAE